MKNLFLFSLVFLAQISFSQIQVFSDGRVGIGTATSGGKLRIDGVGVPSTWNKSTTALEINASGNNQSILQGNGGNGAYRIAIQDGKGRIHHYWNAYTFGSQHRYDNSGEVSTWLKMGDSFDFYIAPAGTADQKITWRRLLYMNPSQRCSFGGAAQVGIRLKIHGNLAVTGTAYKTGGGDWAVLSDQRLKKNVKNFKMGLNEILKIRPVSFQYNGKGDVQDTESEYVGVLAQELREIAPFMVEEISIQSSDTDENGDEKTKDFGNYLTVDPSAITYMLINAIKEQNSQFETLSSTLLDQQTIIDQQKQLIESLTARLDKIEQNCCTANVQNDVESTTIVLENDALDEPKLLQNEPNPLSAKTDIRYYLPSRAESAIIKVFDTNGKIISEQKLVNSGWGSVTIDASNAADGNYIYSLIVDDKLVDSKVMVIQK